MNTLTMYLIVQLDSVREVACAVSVVCILATVIVGVFGTMNSDLNDTPFPRRTVCSLAAGALAALVLLAVLPSTRGAAAIWAVPKIINSEQIQDEAAEIYDLAKQWLKSQSDGAEQESQP